MWQPHPVLCSNRHHVGVERALHQSSLIPALGEWIGATTFSTAWWERRSRLAGELDELHKRVRQTIADIEHLDATIKQFAPGYRLEAIRAKEYRPPSDWSGRAR